MGLQTRFTSRNRSLFQRGSEQGVVEKMNLKSTYGLCDWHKDYPEEILPWDTYHDVDCRLCIRSKYVRRQGESALFEAISKIELLSDIIEDLKLDIAELKAKANG
jgi:hypothetical protein